MVTDRSGPPVFVVSGLPRSGTSLVMQILAAGGVPVLADGVRAAERNDERGFLEYGPVRRLAGDQSWVPAARGQAVKVFLHLLPHLPAGIPLKILLLDRALEDVMASQAAMLRSMGRQPPADPATVAKTFAFQRETILTRMRLRPGVAVLEVSFARLLSGDPAQIAAIADFVGLENPDLEAMGRVVDPGLSRNRLSQDAGSESLKPRLPWQPGTYSGLIVVSVPKSGTNFLSRYLSRFTGWPHRWGRPSRDQVSLLDELPALPDPVIASRALHLIQTGNDIMLLPPEQRPQLFGNRHLVSLEAPSEGEEEDAVRPLQKNWVIAEHPLRSLPWFLRNPRDVPVLQPAEVLAEASELGFGVLFLSRDLKDIVNSLGHFLFAGTRYVHFRSLAESMETAVYLYAPVLAAAIRTWQKDFPGLKIRYEELTQNTRPVLARIVEEFRLPGSGGRLIESSGDFPTFTFRKGGSGDWRNHLTDRQCRFLDDSFPDLVQQE